MKVASSTHESGPLSSTIPPNVYWALTMYPALSSFQQLQHCFFLHSKAVTVKSFQDSKYHLPFKHLHWGMPQQEQEYTMNMSLALSRGSQTVRFVESTTNSQEREAEVCGQTLRLAQRDACWEPNFLSSPRAVPIDNCLLLKAQGTPRRYTAAPLVLQVLQPLLCPVASLTPTPVRPTPKRQTGPARKRVIRLQDGLAPPWGPPFSLCLLLWDARKEPGPLCNAGPRVPMEQEHHPLQKHTSLRGAVGL